MRECRLESLRLMCAQVGLRLLACEEAVSCLLWSGVLGPGPGRREYKAGPGHVGSSVLVGAVG